MTSDAEFPDFNRMTNRDLVDAWVKLVTALEITRGVPGTFDTEASPLFYPAVKEASTALAKRLRGIGEFTTYASAADQFDRIREVVTAEVYAKRHKDALGAAPADWVHLSYATRWEREATARWSEVHRDRCASVDAFVALMDTELPGHA